MLRKVRAGLCLCLILLLGYTAYTAYSIVAYADRSVSHRTDAAIVLGAAVWEDEPSPVLAERMNQAILLYDQELVSVIITTGGLGREARITEAEAARRYAMRHQVKEQDILLEDQSRITEQNVAYAYAIAQEHGLRSFAIVSDPLHMKRAMTMAEDLGMEAYPSPAETSAYQSWKAKGPFLARETFFLIGYHISRLFGLAQEADGQ